MPRAKKQATSGLFDVQEYLKTAPCVPALRAAVKAWKKDGEYKGVTDTTRELLNFWFETDHILPNGKKFKYHDAQREAIETLIYVYEVKKIRSRKELLQEYATQQKDLRLPPRDEFARYCVKMATGSGKTKVMSLAIAWQYFNAMRETEDDYAKTFLLIAPNVIVFERLKQDFESGRVFKTDPIYPRHYEMFWDMQCYMRGDAERASSEGAIYLTNIQQFYERGSNANSDEPEAIAAMLGPKPSSTLTSEVPFEERIAKRSGKVIVINDEAHHTHEEDSEWNNVIYKLHGGSPLAAQLDFSATPRYSKGALFPWTISDYPLKQAILDGIVKRPLKGISKIAEARSEHASTRYQGFLVAGVQRWSEYVEQLAPLKKKPILFVMLNSTDEADDVRDWLKTKYPQHFAGDKLLTIHTDKSGEVSKKDLDDARKIARQVDQESSEVNAIVSVLMLREGWDVQNVTVVVGLRPYTAKANILPEQTIGRGLRLMFGSQSAYKERVDIIGNDAFLKFVDDLEKYEDLQVETFEIGKDKLHIVTIAPMPEKSYADINLPSLTAIIQRKKSLKEEIEQLDVMAFKIRPLPLTGKEIDEAITFEYEGRDIITDTLELTRQYSIPPAQTPEEVIGYYARRIAERIKLPSQFASLAPKVKEFFEHKAFGKTVDLASPDMIRAMSTNLAGYITENEFEKALQVLITEKHEPELIDSGRLLSTTKPFPFSKKPLEASKTVFNYVAPDNEFESAFAQFLQKSNDIESFAKLPESFGFNIEYTDTRTNIRHYYPDFVAKAKNGVFWILETKGREDVEVKLKDEAAIYWCEKATALTDDKWSYAKVPQKIFEELHPDSLEELIHALTSGFAELLPD
ncbi:MAG TPA: DEAD/DEAH box helicase family protein [Candidatus Kapabacteria bacterium]|nr:DEAD/DEAH box helicase family protein [Candidatus Kapabacteria bacterium]